jgi:lipid-A-disaccharide synthase
MKYYLIAGERSGDLHASNLMKAIQKEDLQAEFRYFGGDEMQNAGGTLVKHYREMSFMGITEVLVNLRKISALLNGCKQDLTAWVPDVVILVDYSGFNLRIAKHIKRKQLPIQTFFYISPKIWAWNTKRAWKVKRLIDRMFVIFPFEVAFYQQFDYRVDYVGNPLLDAIARFRPKADFRQAHQLGEKPVIALLPGSRKQEVLKILPKMAAILPHFPDYQFVIAGVSNLPEAYYAPYRNLPNVHIIFDSAYDILTIAESAVVTSGTATLETALLNVPQVVVYQAGYLTYQIVKRLIKVPHISLVNLIAQKEAVRELIQKEFSTENIVDELRKINQTGESRSGVLTDYQALRELMGAAGASEKAARLMVGYLKEARSEG